MNAFLTQPASIKHVPDPAVASHAGQPSSPAVFLFTTGVTASALAFIAVAWFVMWAASVRLSPDPAGDAQRAAIELRRQMIAELEQRGPAGPGIDVQTAKHGRDVFFTTCVTCHGSDGMGRTGLGKSLVRSQFVATNSDLDLVAMIQRGRDVNDPLNTTKVAMPPKGGNAGLGDADLAAVVQYLRGLQDPRRMPELPAFIPPALAAPTQEEKAVALAAAGGDAELAGYIAHGSKLYGTTCIACHGQGGTGLQGNGKPLAGSKFLNGLDDDGLLEFVKKGRSPSDPLNTTGIAMPPKGGNPALSEDDILDIISFLRTLPGNKPVAAQAGK